MLGRYPTAAAPLSADSTQSGPTSGTEAPSTPTVATGSYGMGGMLGFAPLGSAPIAGSLGPPSEQVIDPTPPAGARLAGFEMVSIEPAWKRAIRERAEAKQIGLDRKKRKRAEFIEKLAAKEALSTRPDEQIGTRIDALMAEWLALAPKLDLTPVAEVQPDYAYHAFMARVAEQVRRMEDEDDEYAAEMLLLM